MPELTLQEHDSDEVMEYFINIVHPKAAFRETEITKTKRLQRGLLGLERKKVYHNAGLTVASTDDSDEIPNLLKQHDDADQILLHTPNRHNRLQPDYEQTNEELGEPGSGSDKENGATGRTMFGLSKLKGKGVESMMKMAMMTTISSKQGRPKKQSFATKVSERLAEANESYTNISEDEEEQKPRRRGRPRKNAASVEQTIKKKSRRDEAETLDHSRSHEEEGEQQPRRRGRPPKNAVRLEETISNRRSRDEVKESDRRSHEDEEQKPRRRGRPPKNKARLEETTKNLYSRDEVKESSHRIYHEDEMQKPRRRGRPPKHATRIEDNIANKRQRDDEATELGINSSTTYSASKKKRVIDRQIQLLNEEDEVDSDDDSDENDQDEGNERESEDEQDVPRDTLERDGYERYFQDLHAVNKTSNNTLSKLPILDPQEFKMKLAQAPKKHAKDIAILHSLHERQFPQWQFELLSHYNLLFYGYGSKRKLLTKFVQTYLTDGPLIVVNGYFPSITIKDVLNKLSVGALGINAPTGSIQDHVSLIMEHFQRGENEYEHIYLLIHNIDGANIRNERAQTALSILASCPNIHIIASVDHINAGLLWDSIKISRFNWIWHDATTFDDYLIETSFENTLMVRQSEIGGSRGVNYVLTSLTSNARGIFKVLAEHQVMEMELATMEGRGDDSVGLTYNSYYTKCREAFFVSNDITFRTQLTEFRDHKIIQSKRTVDGTEIMYLPLDKSTLTNILESIS
ncbi:origin recognition complex subunit 2-domain-containing protein [Umbelopsis sp. PMI_123]|nr:origin recognition complex subunit 2-domain-containing protein [Umbelopsis sp. PMI_123]